MGMIIYLFQAIYRTISDLVTYIFIQIDKVLKYDKKIDYFIATLFLLTSGSVCWISALRPAGAYIFLLLVAVINVLRKKRKLNKSWHFILIVVVMCLINAITLQRKYEDNSMLGYIVCITAAYLIISQYEFNYFVKLLTNVLVVILVIGIPIYLLCSFGIIPYHLVYTIRGPSLLCGYIFTYGLLYPFGRFAGIWHEPGACQIILNAILWLNYKKIQNWDLSKHDKIKFTIIIIGILLTQSTGGYLVFLTFLLAIGFTTKIRNRHRIIIYLFLCFSMICTVILLYNNDVIQKKLFVESSQESLSKRTRTEDAVSLIKTANDYPIIGAGIGTDLLFMTSKDYGNISSSSGLLHFTASLGYPWLVLFLIFCFLRIKNMDIGMASWFLFASIIMLEANENYIEYPITSLFIFKFHSYNYKLYTKGINTRKIIL